MLSSYWIALFNPVPAGVIMPLVEGLKNEVVCRNNGVLSLSVHGAKFLAGAAAVEAGGQPGAWTLVAAQVLRGKRCS